MLKKDESACAYDKKIEIMCGTCRRNIDMEKITDHTLFSDFKIVTKFNKYGSDRKCDGYWEK